MQVALHLSLRNSPDITSHWPVDKKVRCSVDSFAAIKATTSVYQNSPSFLIFGPRLHQPDRFKTEQTSYQLWVFSPLSTEKGISFSCRTSFGVVVASTIVLLNGRGGDEEVGDVGALGSEAVRRAAEAYIAGEGSDLHDDGPGGGVDDGEAVAALRDGKREEARASR